jgi:hypothetical protein
MTTTSHLWVWAVPVVLGAPWLMAILLLWRQLPRDGFVPPSMGELARKRF